MKTRESSLIRTRWAAIGAAVAVTLGVGGVGISQATTSTGTRAIYNAIEPCRLADLRPAPDQVGPRATPLGAEESYELSGWGTVGNCDLPTGTAALSLNVTAVGATLPTFLQLYPGGTTRPSEGSNLNPQPGQPPIPNAVNVALGDSGTFEIFNRQGTVAVIIDVVGVFDDHDHDDRYYTKDELGTAITAGNAVRGNTFCEGDGLGFFTANPAGLLVDGRFSFLIPGYGLGLVDDDGTLLIGPAAVGGATPSSERVGQGLYCITYTGTQPGPNIAESAIASIAAPG